MLSLGSWGRTRQLCTGLWSDLSLHLTAPRYPDRPASGAWRVARNHGFVCAGRYSDTHPYRQDSVIPLNVCTQAV